MTAYKEVFQLYLSDGKYIIPEDELFKILTVHTEQVNINREYALQFKTWVIYQVVAPSGNVYVGMTSDPLKRKQMYSWKNGCGEQKLLQDSIDTYGWNTHSFEILFTMLSQEQAAQKEIELIAGYKREGKSLNMANGGNELTGVREIEIFQYTPDKVFVSSYPSIAIAASMTGGNARQIAQVIQRGTHYSKGYLWFRNKTDVYSFTRKKRGGYDY